MGKWYKNSALAAGTPAAAPPAPPVLVRLFDGTAGRPGNGPAAVTAASGGWLLGVIFSVTGQVAWLNGYYHWVPANGDTVARKYALWNQFGTGSNQVLVSGSVVTSGTLTAGAWNFTALSSPVQLAPGGLYVAAVGWTATNGIPLNSAQWGTGDPLAAGIVNQFLTGWSATSGSNTYPAATVNYGLGQNLFSNVLGADPSVAMPNNGSGDDLLWTDVQVDNTAPGGYAGTWRVWPNMADLGNFSLDTATNFTLGLEFSVSRQVTVSNVWFYSPAGVTQLPTATGIFRVSDQALLLTNATPSWSGLAASGWVKSALAGTLAAGQYKVCVCNGAGTPTAWNAAVAGYFSTGFGGAGLTAGPITVPSNAQATSPGQASYNVGAALTFPATSIGPFNYGVDVEVA